MNHPLEWTYLGCVPYQQALRLQLTQARRVAAGGPARLLLLEHPPTITLGRRSQPEHLCLPRAEYQRRGIELVPVPRGGGVTYHGPGQLVGYPVASLRTLHCSVPEWVGRHAQALLGFLERYAVTGGYRPGRPGIWVGTHKIGSLGFHIARGISTHGFALNLSVDLTPFDWIVPCGQPQAQLTSLQGLLQRSPQPEEAAAGVARAVADALQLSWTDPLPANQIWRDLAEEAT